LKYNVTAIVPIEIKEEPLKGSSFSGNFFTQLSGILEKADLSS